MASTLVFLLLLSSSFSLCRALPREAILDAADVLSDSGFVSMALTLEIVAKTLLEPSPSATVFAPSDSAFKKSGQPSLDLLRFHLSPLPLPPLSLRLLLPGSNIPTMLAGQSLTVTASTSEGATSLNNIRITESPIYDDGFLLVYGIERFFDPNFQYTDSNQRPNPNPNPNPSCAVNNNTVSSFDQAVETLKSGGYSAMASFLGMQLSGVADHSGITVFAPTDEVVLNHIGDLGEHPSFFRRHVVPCKLLWNNLVDYTDGSELPTFLEGYSINITRSGGVLILNGVPVFFPDIFFNDKVVVHGVSDVLAVQDNTRQVVHVDDEENVFDPDEF
ncbi:putative fasciclin-like arabinogalactan protein 20 [Gastrolobium bilobum]|uniref:putative fasciclin-like arabinogalactan protein 20 n=1 Tax=Gastrolobium bilobum TaxID=150636 RepID=UPI002AB00196|nr:putative fasciclin-like arabinogalactan protein 20 [Gastrolobium bilobum]